MNVINFAESNCGRIQRHFDGYVDNETLVETNHEVLSHIESCERCRIVLEQRHQIKTSLRRTVQKEDIPDKLRDAVRHTLQTGVAPETTPDDAQMRRLLRRAYHNEAVPASLRPSIQEALRQQPAPGVWTLDPGWQRRTFAIAASVMLATIGLSFFIQWPHPTPSDDFGSGLLRRISSRAADMVHLAVMDHIHCALEFPPMWKRMLSFDEMQEDAYPTNWGPRPLGADFIGIIPIIEERAGPGFVVAQGHRCHAGLGRFFTHVILTRQQGEVVSIVLMDKRPEETLSQLDALRVAREAGGDVVAFRDRALEIAGFETPRFAGFVISNLSRAENLQVASNVVLPIRELLSRLEA